MRFKQTADDKKKKNREKILAANNNKQTRILEKVEPKPKKRYNVDSLASQRAIKQWNMKYGDMYNADGTVKYKVKNNPYIKQIPGLFEICVKYNNIVIIKYLITYYYDKINFFIATNLDFNYKYPNSAETIFDFDYFKVHWRKSKCRKSIV